MFLPSFICSLSCHLLMMLRQLLTDDSRSGDVCNNISCEVPKLHCRILNFDPITPLKSLRANCYGQLSLSSGH